MKRALPAAVLLALALPGCTPAQPASYQSQISAMDTFMTLTVYGDDAQAHCQAAAQELFRLDRLLSVTREESEVWALNHSGGQPVAVSPDTLELLTAAQTIAEQTGGALDVSLYPVVRSWGFTTGEHHIPEQAELDQLFPLVDQSRLVPDTTADPATLTLPAGMELDFGSLAKGYAGESCARLLKEAGVSSALLNLGGNIQTIGAKPDGSAWRVGIQDPKGSEEDYVGIVELVDQAAITSGGYQRYFEQDGVRYWHILDPRTGSPARSGLSSVTVIGSSGTRCDGLSTALFVAGLDGARDYYHTYGDVELVLVTEEEQVWITPGLAESFTLTETNYTLHIMEESDEGSF